MSNPIPVAEQPVLVVAREPALVLNFQRSLSKLGYRVVIATTSSEEAWGVAETSPPVLVFIDASGDHAAEGVELARALRARFDFALIYITDGMRDDSASSDGWLQKPFTQLQLEFEVMRARGMHDSRSAKHK